MATQEHTQANPIPFEFRTMADELHAVASRLYALLCMTYGEGGEAFRMYSDEVQENYMWQCTEMASDLSEQLGRIACGQPLKQ